MPVVIALMGLPGSGKTTVAERLVGARDLSLVSRDAIRAAMFRPCRYAEQEKQAAYRAVLLAVASCLELGRSCVVEGMPFSRAREVDELRELAQRAGARFMPVLLAARSRLRKRARIAIASGKAARRTIGTSGWSPASRSVSRRRHPTRCVSTRPRRPKPS